MIGRLLDGRYQIRSRIARGGMATVYLATDLRLERRVAIKVMHGHLADDSQFKERFIQEARSAARLAHPNVVNVFDQGQDSDMAYLVMEYLPGITLRDLLHEHHVLTTDQTLDILEAVLAGLAAAHKAGIVHRDLKPENVLLADDGRIKIGDFGLARAASANTATGAALLGTIAYLSPELVTRGIADTRSDIYAVGIMMYEMLAGEQPFKGDQPMQIAYQHANNAVPAPGIKNPKVPHELDELVLWATSRDPEQRPRDARAMLDQLFEVHSQLMSAPTKKGSSTGPQTRTMVMPSASARAETAPTNSDNSTTAETQVLGARGRSSYARPPADNAAALAVKARKRRRRTGWIVAVVVVLVALAAGTGWYFGAGPGSKVGIPGSISGLSVEDATTRLTALGLKVNPATGSTDSPTVAVGAVAQTDPAIGSHATKGSEVRLLLSTGPKLLPVPVFVGMTQDQAEAAIKAAPFTLGDLISQFDASIPTGTVIEALAADGTTLTGVATYGEGQRVSLVVSVGSLPEVSGLSVADATTKLGAVGLTIGAIKQDNFSDTVPQGNVIRAQATDGTSPVRKGDTVDLVTSKGVEMVAVPAVIGESWTNAKQQLLAAGFRLSYSPLADASPDSVTVATLKPDAGTSQPKGTTISVTFAF
jgi:serine/threonine protein kinase/beta-lactam-binding protein with PASTA domain